MYNGMYWNDIQLIFFWYTHITFCFDRCFVLHNIQKWNYSRRSVNGQHVGSWLSLTLPVFHAYIKNVELRHINNTYMLQPRARWPRRASCLLSPCFWEARLLRNPCECLWGKKTQPREGVSPSPSEGRQGDCSCGPSVNRRLLCPFGNHSWKHSTHTHTLLCPSSPASLCFLTSSCRVCEGPMAWCGGSRTAQPESPDHGVLWRQWLPPLGIQGQGPMTE